MSGEYAVRVDLVRVYPDGTERVVRRAGSWTYGDLHSADEAFEEVGAYLEQS